MVLFRSFEVSSSGIFQTILGLFEIQMLCTVVPCHALFQIISLVLGQAYSEALALTRVDGRHVEDIHETVNDLNCRHGMYTNIGVSLAIYLDLLISPILHSQSCIAFEEWIVS